MNRAYFQITMNLISTFYLSLPSIAHLCYITARYKWFHIVIRMYCCQIFPNKLGKREHTHWCITHSKTSWATRLSTRDRRPGQELNATDIICVNIQGKKSKCGKLSLEIDLRIWFLWIHATENGVKIIENVVKIIENVVIYWLGWYLIKLPSLHWNYFYSLNSSDIQ